MGLLDLIRGGFLVSPVGGSLSVDKYAKVGYSIFMKASTQPQSALDFALIAQAANHAARQARTAFDHEAAEGKANEARRAVTQMVALLTPEQGDMLRDVHSKTPYRGATRSVARPLDEKPFWAMMCKAGVASGRVENGKIMVVVISLPSGL